MKINRKSFMFKKISIASLSLVILTLVSCGKKVEAISFNFASTANAAKVPMDVYYDDDYFDKGSSEYQTPLATASACLALSGFPSDSIDYTKKPENTIDFFNKLGFKNFKSNEYGITKPQTDSFGVYIASKKIDDYTLIGATVRGAGYDSEWASNLTLGNDNMYAKGFYDASEIYLDALKDYIQSNNINGKIKLWTAGYSRGGAGVNLAVGRMTDALLDGNSLLPSQVNYTKEDLYAYCFETPAGKIADLSGETIKEKGKDYSHIRCFINPNDIVPFLAPKEFNFVRYGVDYYLPDITNNINYENHIKKVKNVLNTLSNLNDIGEYQLDNFVFKTSSRQKLYNWTLGRFLEHFINNLAKGIGDVETYSTEYQPQIRELATFFLNGSSGKDSFIDFAINLAKNIAILDTNEQLLLDLQHNIKRFYQDLRPIVIAALKKSNVDLEPENLYELIKKVFTALITIVLLPDGLNELTSLVSMSNIKALAYGHYPELLLSHMISMDSNYTKGEITAPTTSFLKVTMTGNGEFNVKSGLKKLLKKDNDGLDASIAVKENIGTSYEFYLPVGSNYTIDLKSGEFEIQIEEISGLYSDKKTLLVDKINDSNKSLKLTNDLGGNLYGQ